MHIACIRNRFNSNINNATFLPIKTKLASGVPSGSSYVEPTRYSAIFQLQPINHCMCSGQITILVPLCRPWPAWDRICAACRLPPWYRPPPAWETLMSCLAGCLHSRRQAKRRIGLWFLLQAEG